MVEPCTRGVGPGQIWGEKCGTCGHSNVVHGMADYMCAVCETVEEIRAELRAAGS